MDWEQLERDHTDHEKLARVTIDVDAAPWLEVVRRRIARLPDLEALALAGKRLADAVEAERDARRTQIGPHSASSERDAALVAFRDLERGE